MLFVNRGIPPDNPSEAARWWTERIDSLPRDFLAVYVEAAEVHRKQGTAATYVELRGGHTMIGRVGEEIRLSCPPPDDVLSRMRVKAGEISPTQHLLTAEKCRGCTPEEAERIWKDAVQKVADRNPGK